MQGGQGLKAPLGTCGGSFQTGFPAQCRLYSASNNRRVLAAGSTIQFPIDVGVLHAGTVGMVHLAGTDATKQEQYINLTPNGAFDFKDGLNNIQITIPNVKAGDYRLCYNGYAGVIDNIGLNIPSNKQHHWYNVCTGVQISNDGTASNFAVTPMVLLDVGPIQTAPNDRTVVEVLDAGFSTPPDRSGTSGVAFLRSQIQQVGQASYCAADGEVHAGSPANACSAPLIRIPNFRINNCGNLGSGDDSKAQSNNNGDNNAPASPKTPSPPAPPRPNNNNAPESPKTPGSSAPPRPNPGTGATALQCRYAAMQVLVQGPERRFGLNGQQVAMNPAIVAQQICDQDRNDNNAQCQTKCADATAAVASSGVLGGPNQNLCVMGRVADDFNGALGKKTNEAGKLGRRRR